MEVLSRDELNVLQMAEKINNPLRKAAFLDRDGVINKDKGYVGRWEDFEFVPGALRGMKLLQNMGYVLVIVTNQSGLARAYYSEEQYQALNRQIYAALKQARIQVGGIYHCPHHPKGVVPELSIHCECRKPAPGLLIRASRDLSLSMQDSLLIGDMPSDIEAARAAGLAKAYAVSSKNFAASATLFDSDGYFDNLLACAKYLVHTHKFAQSQ